MHSADSKKSRGFTLIESITSIAVIALVSVAAVALFNTSTLTKTAQQQDIAIRIANSKIQDIRAAGYANTPSNGAFSDTLLSTLPSGVGSTTTTTFNSGVKQVTVQVLWQQQNTGTTSVTLTTLLAQSGGL